MENGEMIEIDYIGKTDGEIFDLTVEEKAEEEGIDTSQLDLEPMKVLLGENYIIPGLEEALKEMEVGEEKELEISAEEGYGERDSDKIETFPEKNFKEQDVKVRPGEEIMIGGRRGKVVSKGSGRVRVDFNHPLAGKDLDYWVKIVGKVEDDGEIAQGILDHRLGHGELEFDGETVTVIHEHDQEGHSHSLNPDFKERLSEEIKEHTDFEEVEFEE
jgi:FKBP-type peptidyl-prolyl cis-trans isomerase SlyD